MRNVEDAQTDMDRLARSIEDAIYLVGFISIPKDLGL